MTGEFKAVKAIGDAYQTGNIASSVKSGFYAAYFFEDETKEML